MKIGKKSRRKGDGRTRRIRGGERDREGEERGKLEKRKRYKREREEWEGRDDIGKR